MPRKQVLVQLDEDLIADIDALATELDINRSELLRRAARSMLDTAQTMILEKQHHEGYLRIPEDMTWRDDFAEKKRSTKPSRAAESASPYRARRATR